MGNKKTFVNSAIILMVSGLITRLLGFIYRIYISNLLGSEGIGLFQLISPVYSLIILTLTSGVSIAVSKMVARELARRHFVNVRRITKIALLLVFMAGMGISTLLLLRSRFISNILLKEPRTYYSIMLLIPSIPIIALSSTLKGYFYGTQDMMPTAWAQIGEQIVRIGLVMFLARQFLHKGAEYACALVTGAMAIGEVVSLVILYIKYRSKVRLYGKEKSKRGLIRKRRIIFEMLETSLPVSANRFITSIMSAIELILIPRRLLAGGMDYHESIGLYGKLTGMAVPLIYFPCIVTSSLAITLVPAISEALSLKSFRTVNYRISKSVQISFMLGFIFTAIFACYPGEIGNAIFKNENVGELLYYMAFTCLFIYLQQTLSGIMNGLGKQRISLRNSIIGYIIRIGFVYFLIPLYGIKSYVIAMFISALITSISNLITVIKITGLKVDIKNWILKPGIVGIFMLFAGKYILSFFTIFTKHEMLVIMLSVGGNVFIGFILMVILGVLEKDLVFKMLGLKKS